MSACATLWLLSEYLHFGKAQVVRAGELHAHIPALSAGQNHSGWVGRRGLTTAGCPRPDLQCGGRVSRQERGVGDKHPIVVQPGAATIGAIPDDDGTDRR